MWHTWLVPDTPLLVARERVRIYCVVTQRGEDEPESRGDVAHVVGAGHSPPLVARERVRPKESKRT